MWDNKEINVTESGRMQGRIVRFISCSMLDGMGGEEQSPRGDDAPGHHKEHNDPARVLPGMRE